MNRRFLAMTGIFISGTCLGIAGSWTWLEVRANNKYQQWVQLRTGVETHLEELREARPVAVLKEEMKADKEAVAGISIPYVPPEVVLNRPEFELIDEDEYGSNAMFDKITIEIFRDDLQYQLVVDGETTIDWQDILTPHVIEELKGKEELYVRNNAKKEDYHVTWGQP